MADKVPATDELYGMYHARVDELNRRVKQGEIEFQTTMDSLQDLLDGRRRRLVLDPPEVLTTILQKQVDRLVEVGAPKEAKQSEDGFRKCLGSAIDRFVEDRPRSVALARICLVDVAIFDPRLRPEWLADKGEVYIHDSAKPEKCSNYGTIPPPPEIQTVIQAQWGPKYQNEKPIWVRDNLHADEQGLTVWEGLFAYLYNGKRMLDECNLDLIGSVSEYDYVPILYWHDCGAELSASSYATAIPNDSSASRGS